MKSIAMIASAILIVLISQHSIMGLPLNNTLVCSEGMGLIDGRCVLISALNTSIEHENSSHVTDIFPLHLEAPSTQLMPLKTDGSCPQGMKHGKYGICEDIQNSTNNEVDLPTTTAFWDHPTTEFHDLPATTEYVAVSTTTELNVPLTTPKANVEATTEFVDVSTTTELNTPSTRRFKGKSGILQTTAGTPSDYDELTTTSTEFADASTTTELNTPTTRRFKGKSATSQTTAGTPSDYDELSTTTELNVEATTEFIDVLSTTELNTPTTRRFKGKSATSQTTAGTPSDYDELTTTTELNTPSTRKLKVKSTTLSTTTQTPSDYDELSTTTTELNTPLARKLKAKSTTLPTTTQTPSDYDELSTTTELNAPSTRKLKVKSTTFQTITQASGDYDELTTTTERDESVGGVDIVKGCPKGTQPDEDGACVSTEPINSTKVTTNPKMLLNNGSCPTDYKMIEGRCLFIKSKLNSTLYQTGALPKSGINSQSDDESVPVLADNSCPEGTEYSEFGLCRKRVYATTPRLLSINKSQGGCAEGYQPVNGKCVSKSQLSRSKSTLGVISTTTPSEEESSVSKTTPAVEAESAYENHTEDTPSPL